MSTAATDETRRLARLRELMVLDTVPEAVFDSVVQMASRICDAPISLVSLVDDQRQWFKAQTGMPGTGETPRQHAFCAHAIQSGDALEIPDARLDPRFRDNPCVTGDPHIRYSAGAPWSLPTGERVETPCIIDRAPRRLAPAQLQVLQELAGIATHTLLMRRDLIAKALSARSEFDASLSVSEQLHRAIVEEPSELISWARVDGNLLYGNPAYNRTVGRSSDSLVGQSLDSYVDESDRELVRDRIDWVLSTGESIVGEKPNAGPAR